MFLIVTRFVQNGWSCSLRVVTVDMISSAVQSGSSLSNGSICARLIEELVRIASDDESQAAVVSPALQASSALACTCSSEQVCSIVQTVLARLSASSQMDSDLSVCLLHAAAFAIRRFATCTLKRIKRIFAHAFAALTLMPQPSAPCCSTSPVLHHHHY